MRRSGFTMIELIFVIVILGILAAVAIPKLMATRTDAKATSRAQEISAAISEISAYVTAQGGDVNETNMTKMSQVLKTLKDNGDANESIISTGRKVVIYGKDTSTCIRFETNQTALQIYHGSDTSLLCTGIKSIIKEKNITLAGSSVKF